MVTGDTSMSAVWWWVGPLTTDWLAALTVTAAVAALAVAGIVHLALSRFNPPPGGDSHGECAETVELPRRGGPGSIHTAGVQVVADLPTQVISRVGDR